MDAAPVAYPPAYADALALVPALRGRPWAHGERLDALARLSTRAELVAIAAPEARVRTAHLLLAETARALHALLAAGPPGVGPSGRDPRSELDVGARLGLAARVARMAGWLGARLPDEDYAAPAHALCAEVHASLL